MVHFWRAEVPRGLAGLPSFWRLLGQCFLVFPSPAAALLPLTMTLQSPSSCCLDLTTHWATSITQTISPPREIYLGTLALSPCHVRQHIHGIPGWEHRLLPSHVQTLHPTFPLFPPFSPVLGWNWGASACYKHPLSQHFISSPQTCTINKAKQITKQKVLKLMSPLGHWNLLFQNPSP